MDHGWGRIRPTWSELVPSAHAADSDDVNGVDCDGMIGDDMHSELGMSMDENIHSTDRVAPLIDYPLLGYDGAPCGELGQHYVNQGYDFKGLKEYYYTLDNGAKSPNTRFVSIFTCPVTGEHFSSGILPIKEMDSVVINGMPWYKTKKLAVTAAAAKALDCLSLRRCHGTEKTHWQRCSDSPYLSDEEAPLLPELPLGVVLPIPPRISPGEPHEHADVLHPKQALVQYYVSFIKSLEMRGICLEYPANESGPKSEWYSCWPNMNDSTNTMWTAIFTCRLSGERFPSGRLHGREDAYKTDCWYYDSSRCMIFPRENMEVEDFHESNYDRVEFIWYRTKKEAINAAAGRALDCLRHRDSGSTLSFVRYCCELPYTVDETPEIWKRVCITARGVCGIDWPSLPLEDRQTTHFGVSDLHCLLKEEQGDDNWRTRYKDKRYTLDRDIN